MITIIHHFAVFHINQPSVITSSAPVSRVFFICSLNFKSFEICKDVNINIHFISFLKTEEGTWNPCSHTNLCSVYTKSPRDWLKTKLVVSREMIDKVVCFSYVAHQKVISYSWLLAITQAFSPLTPESFTIAFNRQKRSWNLSISLASDPARSWILLWSLVFAGWS